MKYKNAILMCIDYIERNIKEELTIEIIAKEVGYSPYHFSRVFKKEMGIPLMEYVKERRLINASKEIFLGRKIIDVSIDYNYQTHSGFSKAFKKKFGFSPSIIHGIRMSFDLLNKKGGNYPMNEKRKEMENKAFEKANLFVKSSEDFVEPQDLYKTLIDSIKRNKLFDDLSMIEKAYYTASRAHEGQFRMSGEPYIIHPLSVAIILAEMEADEETLISGLLHDVIEEKTMISIKQIATDFSEEIAQLVKDTSDFRNMNNEVINNCSVDNRVIMIKLADRLHNMRTIKYIDDEKWREKARETIEIFSPIAAKLGISKLKVELDDLSLMYL